MKKEGEGVGRKDGEGGGACEPESVSSEMTEGTEIIPHP